MENFTKDQLSLSEVREMDMAIASLRGKGRSTQKLMENAYIAGFGNASKALSLEIAGILRQAANDIEKIAKEK